MSKERAGDLARQCTKLVRQGNNFTTVWSTLLKRHICLLRAVSSEDLNITGISWPFL